MDCSIYSINMLILCVGVCMYLCVCVCVCVYLCVCVCLSVCLSVTSEISGMWRCVSLILSPIFKALPGELHQLLFELVRHGAQMTNIWNLLAGNTWNHSIHVTFVWHIRHWLSSWKGLSLLSLAETQCVCLHVSLCVCVCVYLCVCVSLSVCNIWDFRNVTLCFLDSFTDMESFAWGVTCTSTAFRVGTTWGSNEKHLEPFSRKHMELLHPCDICVTWRCVSLILSPIWKALPGELHQLLFELVRHGAQIKNIWNLLHVAGNTWKYSIHVTFVWHIRHWLSSWKGLSFLSLAETQQGRTSSLLQEAVAFGNTLWLTDHCLPRKGHRRPPQVIQEAYWGRLFLFHP